MDVDELRAPPAPPRALRARALLRAAAARSPRLHAVLKSAPVQHQVMTWRAVGVLGGGRRRFLARQLLGRRGTGHPLGGYRLGGSGLRFHVRHRTGDVLILNKIFARERARSSYRPPAGAAALIGPAPRVLDVGANIGMFGLWALRSWPGARVTAYEPDPDNLRVLRRTVAANDTGGRWAVVPAAVSTAPAALRFRPGLRAEAHLADGEEEGLVSVPAVDFYAQVDDAVDLVKMDIEGGEWAILADPRLRTLRASVIRLEWHTRLCPVPGARGEARRLLRAGGYRRVVDAEREHDRNGVLWAWREPSGA